MYKRLTITAALTLSLMATGCQTKGQTGALVGAGIGALAGQAIGGNTAGTLIGAGVGAGIGYIIGNEKDKKDARQLQKENQGTSHDQVGSLGGTRWKIVSISPAGKHGKATSRIVEFSKDGHVTTTTTRPDGTVETSSENYRVSGGMIIVNKPGYLVNYTFTMNSRTLTADADECHLVLERI